MVRRFQTEDGEVLVDEEALEYWRTYLNLDEDKPMEPWLDSLNISGDDALKTSEDGPSIEGENITNWKKILGL